MGLFAAILLPIRVDTSAAGRRGIIAGRGMTAHVRDDRCDSPMTASTTPIPLRNIRVGPEPSPEPPRLLGIFASWRLQAYGHTLAAGYAVFGPIDSGPPVGYWGYIVDPDGHNLEISFGQEVGLTVDAAADAGA